MKLSEAQIRGAIAEQAGDWFVAHRSGMLAYADRVAFVQWLRASPAHVEEYLGIARIAGDLPVVTAELDESQEVLVAQARADRTVASFQPAIPQRSPPAQQSLTRRHRALTASAACAMVVLAALGLWRLHDGELLGLPKTYQTAHGEQSAVLLPDKSLMRLNTDTSVTVHYSSAERVIDVERGQALFQVVHGNRRGFRVAAGDAQVRAVGTEFDVFRRPGIILVTVVEGAVAVSTAGVEPAGTGSAAAVQGQPVPAGYQLRIDGGVMAAHPSQVDLRQSEAWVQRRIVFEKRPLGDVAEEFNRYGRVQLIVSGATLRALPVSGVFNAYDMESFVTFLGTLEGVKVERTPAQISISRVPASAQ